MDGGYWLYWHSVNPEALVMRGANFYASSCLYWLCGFIWLHNGPLRELFSRHAENAKRTTERLTLRKMVFRVMSTIILFWVAYYIYSAQTGTERMTEVCRQIRPGMDTQQLIKFAEQHGLGPRQLNRETRLAYLGEARTLGRHACRVELEAGKVRNSTYNFAD